MAPIILFVYNRPEHLILTLKNLILNVGYENSILYIFSEGPKPDASETERSKIQEVRKIIKELKGFKKIIIEEAQSNKGCANSMTEGISKVLKIHESAIILEDDILTHPLFLSFCNKGLQLYKDEKTVKQIGGFMFPGKSNLPKIFHSRSIFCWGWATWKRSWDELNMDAENLRHQIISNGQINQFDLEGAYPYFKSLEEQIEGHIDAWDICWYASCFLNNGQAVYPGKSLTQNIGMDGSGTHFTEERKNKIVQFDEQADVNILSAFPSDISINSETENMVHEAVKNWIHVPFTQRVKSGLKKVLFRIGLRASVN